MASDFGQVNLWLELGPDTISHNKKLVSLADLSYHSFNLMLAIVFFDGFDGFR